MSQENSKSWLRLAALHGEKMPRDRLLEDFFNHYRGLLAACVQDNHDEQVLHEIFLLGREMVRARLYPEEVAEIHGRAAIDLGIDYVRGNIAFMELMVAFGGSYRSLLEQSEKDTRMRSEYASLKRALGDTIEAINRVKESSDSYTASHQQRVALLACEIARQLGLDEERVEGLRLAASLHDVGMVQVPVNMLGKHEKLDADEMAQVRVHPQVGYDMLKDIDLPWPVAEITRQHHERIDGSGYPFGLEGTDILMEARIISVADTVEAMVSHRPYRAPLDVSQALEEIRSGRGKAFDAEVVDACCLLFTDKGFSFIH